MSNSLSKKAATAKSLLGLAKAKSDSGDFAYKLAARSLETHLDELSQIELTSQTSPAFEMLDFRIKVRPLITGSAPLELVAKLSEEVRKTLGYAALRIMQGGIKRKRVPKDLYSDLDLRLVGLLPGSSRFIISAAANRDLFDDGLNKGAIERLFMVLSSMGQGADFLSAVNILGPSSAKSLRELLKTIRSYSAEAEFTWKYAGDEIKKWEGSREAIDSVTSALELTEITEQEKIILIGKIELLSKRERIELRVGNDRLIKVLYPKSMLPFVSELHLGQEVTINCQVTETENPLTNESSIFYELIEIMQNK